MIKHNEQNALPSTKYKHAKLELSDILNTESSSLQLRNYKFNHLKFLVFYDTS
jgi:hypothetical protein